MTSDPNLMNRLVTEEQNRIKLLVAKFSEMMQLAGVSGIFDNRVFGYMQLHL